MLSSYFVVFAGCLWTYVFFNVLNEHKPIFWDTESPAGGGFQACISRVSWNRDSLFVNHRGHQFLGSAGFLAFC
jgi:hypothetical protein